jgi:hypothetical protein
MLSAPPDSDDEKETRVNLYLCASKVCTGMLQTGGQRYLVNASGDKCTLCTDREARDKTLDWWKVSLPTGADVDEEEIASDAGAEVLRSFEDLTRVEDDNAAIYRHMGREATTPPTTPPAAVRKIEQDRDQQLDDWLRNQNEVKVANDEVAKEQKTCHEKTKKACYVCCVCKVTVKEENSNEDILYAVFCPTCGDKTDALERDDLWGRSMAHAAK